MKSPIRQLANEYFLGLLDRGDYVEKRRELISSLVAGASENGTDGASLGGAPTIARTSMEPATGLDALVPRPGGQAIDAGLLTQPLLGEASSHASGDAGRPMQGADLSRALTGEPGQRASAPPADTQASLNPLDALASLDRKIEQRPADERDSSGFPGAAGGPHDYAAKPATGERGGSGVKLVVVSLLVLAALALAGMLVFIS